ncbi:MAG: manganese efflux pump [Clostridia bacterium]|nr:manganese efflux pump [Clostridia bacterium]
MDWSAVFFINSILLGVGLAMDAFSVSLADGLSEPEMSRKKIAGIAGTFALFQGIMPLIGWICVHTVITYFKKLETFIPWIALILLLFLGGKMIYEGIKNKERSDAKPKLGLWAILVQGVATSIDALSVGFTIAEYGTAMALVCAAIIAAITLGLCIAGLLLGRTFGTRMAGKATIIGGIILIAIGIEIFVRGVFF